MQPPRIESPTGAVNGVNKIYYVSADYVPGTVRVFINGQVKAPELEDGHTELGGRKINIKEAPRIGDVVRIYYIPIG